MKEKKTTFEQVKEQLKKEILYYTIGDWIKFIILIAITVLIVAMAVLYLLNMLYAINIASDPCGVCRELNPTANIIYNQIKINLSNINIT